MGAMVTWNFAAMKAMTTTMPEAAFQKAASISAGAAARKIGGKGTGALARDVANWKQTGPMSGLIGSLTLPYARIENFGGTITPKRFKRLYIRGKRIGAAGQTTRSSFGGEITATAKSVKHKGKHYLEVALKMYPKTYMTLLKQSYGSIRI